MDAMNVLQIVGYKNSGKTTLIEKWLDLLSNDNIQVAVIKHHGHETPLEMPSDQTDSMRFLNRGAMNSVVVDSNMLQLHWRATFHLDDLIALSSLSKSDFIFVEGFKNQAYPKVVIVRSVEDWQSLQKLKNIVLVVVHEGIHLNFPTVVSQSDEESLKRWIIDYVKGD